MRRKKINIMKAEEFIKDCNKTCSNELDFGQQYADEHLYHEWVTPEQALAACALAREELLAGAMDGEIEIEKNKRIKVKVIVVNDEE